MNRKRVTFVSAAAAAVALASAAGAGETFTARFDISTEGDAPNTVLAADVDGDGDVDVISCGGEAILWHENLDGDPHSWTTRTIFTFDVTGRSVDLADIDNDGDIDLVSADGSASINEPGPVRWHENDGGSPPSFNPHLVASPDAGVNSVRADDLNGDGLVDILTAYSDEDAIRWHRQVPGESVQFVVNEITDQSGSAVSAEFGDVDGDGDMDVLATNSDEQTVLWYENLGGIEPSFAPRVIASTDIAGQLPFRAAPTDLDDDGDLDVISAWSGFNAPEAVRWHENVGGSPPAFTTHDVIIEEGGSHNFAVADIDDDGDRDLLTSASGLDAIRWHENAGGEPEQFLPHLISNSADNAASVAAADIDGDGDMDALSASAFDDAVRWYRNDGDVWPRVCFEDHLITDVGNAASAVAPMDLEGDGDADLFSTWAFDGSVRWHRNDGGDPPQFLLGEVSSAGNPVWVSPADIDGDGNMDAVSASFFSGLLWHRNADTEPPTFETFQIDAGETVAIASEAADLDDDGDPDLIATWSSAASDPLQWYENLGGDPPQFAAGRAIAPGADSAGPARTVDFDGDGDTDLVSALDDSPVWLENDGGAQPTFTIHSLNPEVEGGLTFPADLDGDGDTDVISSSSFNERLRWHENLAGEGGGFAVHPIASVAGGQPGETPYLSTAVAADMDGDADLDILAGYSEGDPVRWFENIGGDPPQFVMHIVSTAPDDVRSVRAADVDGDGFLDILSASFNDDSVRWHENLYAIPGDLTDDGEVDGGDLGVLLGAWGPCGEGETCQADLNDDGFVDGADLGVLLGAWR